MARIAVVGLGKLGFPMAAIFASKGHSVIGVDKNPDRVQAMRSRIDPVGETGLGLMLRGPKMDLEATANIDEAVQYSDITFVVVHTPCDGGVHLSPRWNGTAKFSLEYVLDACGQIGLALKDRPGFHIVAITSTVCPGDTDGQIRTVLERTSAKKAGIDFGLCYNPEFIALGSVIHNFLNPDFILIGESDVNSGRMLADLYHALCNTPPQIRRMGITNAELTKLALNTFVTTKISYANMLAQLCEGLPGGDVDVVTDALGFDTRIGKKYLKGGSSFGGPCFPRDNLALVEVAKELHVPVDIPAAIHGVNRHHTMRLCTKIEESIERGGTIGVSGIAYKPDTAVTESAVGFEVANWLVAEGYNVNIFDPMYRDGVEGARQYLHAAEFVRASNLVVATLPCKELSDLPEDAWEGKTVIDCWRFLKDKAVRSQKYIGIGLGPRIDGNAS